MKLWMAPAGLHVEMATSQHISAMAKLHGQSFFHGWAETDFSAYILRPDINPTFVACTSKGKVAGFMVLSIAGEECELLSISVDRKWRKKGVARALLQAGFDDLLSSPAQSMYLEVEEANGAAIALYRHFGFEEIGRRPGYYPQKDGSGATALVLRIHLN